MNSGQTANGPTPVPRVSYAQNMEDILLDRLFKDQVGTFMDVGANHPILDNNTYFFYLRGWQGINLEPIRRLRDLFLEHRPEDTTLAVAASDTEGTLPFYEVTNSDGLSTLSPDIAKRYRQRGLAVTERQLPVRTIDSLVKEYRIRPPDFLSIDVEGHEDQVIRGIPLATWRPKVLVVESTLPESTTASFKSWEPILLENGYLFAAFNGINRFYLRDDLRDKLNCFEYPVNVLDCYKRYETVALEKSVQEVRGEVARIEAAWAADRARFEEIRAGWEWGREQADQLRRAWEQERAAWEGERIRVGADREATQRGVAELERHAQALAKESEALRNELAESQRHAQGLAREDEAREREVAELQQALKDQEAQVRLMADREKELREMLLDAHDRLLRRDEEIQAALATALQQYAPAAPVVTGAIAPDKGALPGHYLLYQRLLHQIREVVDAELPPDATVVVVSKGDDELLKLGGRKAWHFPQNDAGIYAGYNPADSAAAIEHLEALRAKGGEFLLFPSTGLWWLDHYREFRDHLEKRYPTVVRRDGVCVIFALQGPAVAEKEQYRHLVERVRGVVDRALPPDATVAVVSKGDDELLKLGGRKAWHFPQDERGVYAGYNPADGAAAVDHLERLRAKGADFLVVPATALWWLDHYADFRRHLERHSREVARQEDTGVIFALRADHGANGVRPHQTAASNRTPFGVNIAGCIASEKGTGEAVRSTVRSMEAANIPYVLNDFVDEYSANLDTSFAAHLSRNNPYGINLIQVNADSVPEFVRRKGKAYLRDRYNIGYWFWELSDFPPQEWQSSFQYLDEIWVGSNFALDAVSRVAPIPVVRIPVSLPDELGTGGKKRSHFGLPKNKFIFLFMFDFMSIAERKNPLGLIKAFKAAFSRKDDALLVLKCSGSSPDKLQAVGTSPAVVEEIKKASTNANIRIVDGTLGRKETNDLLRLSDCYVSLHRSEGFGLTMAEAMSLEKPVIATAYSGNMDFMTPANSFLVKYKLVELGQDYGPYKKGCVWAEPDIDHAAELMRLVFEKNKLGKKIGRKARQDVLRHLHPRVVGELITERFRKLAFFGKIAAAPGDAAGPRAARPALNGDAGPEENGGYRQLVARIREAVRTALPADATVLVVSKGDEDLLELAGRKGWHFPQDKGGAYAGHNPADGAAAIAHLEELRAKGADYLLLPGTALWWLEHYQEFRQHLETHYRRLRSDDSCVIYELSPTSGRPAAAEPGASSRR
jgi:FkbM family methyltransferase